MIDLPAIAALALRCQSLAMLEAIVSPEDWEMRLYSFDAHCAPGERMASMRNGLGDEYFIWWSAAGAVVKVFDHERPGGPALLAHIRQALPAALAGFLDEPAFSPDDCTAFAWCVGGNQPWQALGDWNELLIDELGPLSASVDVSQQYADWAQDYWELQLPMPGIAAVFAHQGLSQALVQSLNPETSLAAVTADAQAIGYPIGPT